MSGALRIGGLARATGRSVHAIRWYEQQGLIHGVDRDSGGRRVYRAEHVDWLHFLDRLRFAGLTVREMQTYASLVAKGWASLPERRKLLQRHRGMIAARIDELSEALALIDWKIDYYAAWEKQKARPVDTNRPPIRPRRCKARSP